MDLTYPPAQQPDVVGVPRKRISLHDVFLLYRLQFRRWFFVTAPTSLIAAGVLFIADQQANEILRSIPRGETQYHFAELLEAGAIRYSSFFLSWFLGCFALAAIASAISPEDSEDEAVWRHDDHQRAREHLGRIFLIAALTFCVFLAGLAIVVLLVEDAAARVAGDGRILRGITMISYLPVM